MFNEPKFLEGLQKFVLVFFDDILINSSTMGMGKLSLMVIEFKTL